MSTFLRWLCSNCGKRNDDEVDPVYGPFLTCTCDDCGRSFNQDTVQKVE